MEKDIQRKDIIEKLDSDLTVIKTKNDLASLKALYLGKTGVITNLSSKMKELDPSDRKEYGKFLKNLKWKY